MQYRLALIVVALLIGCGEETSDREQVAEVVERFQRATADRDAATYCQLLNSNTREEIVLELREYVGGGYDCARIMQRAMLVGDDKTRRAVRRAAGKTGPEDVTIKGDEAEVRLPSGRTLGLKRVGSEWLVSRLPDTP